MRKPARITSILIRNADWLAMRSAVAQAAPEEGCGLLGGFAHGDDCRVETVIPVTNALHSPVRFRMQPQEQLDAFERLDAAGLALVGIYHSHPNGPDEPSPTDLAEAYYPEAVSVIWSSAGGVWGCRAFQLQNGKAHRVMIRIIY